MPDTFKKKCLFMAVPGLRCCVGFSLVVGSGGCSLVAVLGLLIVVASFVAEHRLWSTGSVVVEHKLSYSVACGTFPDQELNPCLLHWQAEILNHWATREAPFSDIPLQWISTDFIRFSLLSYETVLLMSIFKTAGIKIDIFNTLWSKSILPGHWEWYSR